MIVLEGGVHTDFIDTPFINELDGPVYTST